MSSISRRAPFEVSDHFTVYFTDAVVMWVDTICLFLAESAARHVSFVAAAFRYST